MLTLANDTLTVELLDPVADRARLGPRFCHGGYVWQVRDARAGPLLAGPEYPNPAPTAFNGQGLPESFRWGVRGRDKLLTIDAATRRGLVLGAGDAQLDASGDAILTHPCAWALTRQPDCLEFCARQIFGGWDLELHRTVTLAGRRLVSATSLGNHGANPLPLHWFAHPFFALTDGLISGELPGGFALADNPGFALAHGRFAMKQRYATLHDGHFDLLKPAPVPLTITLTHPRLRFVRLTADFVADEIAVWANNNTFSIEPYLLTELAPGAAKRWSLTYEFGEPAI